MAEHQDDQQLFALCNIAFVQGKKLSSKTIAEVCLFPRCSQDCDLLEHLLHLDQL